MKHILLIYILVSIQAFGQTEITLSWNAFGQSFDMTTYKGGEFRFKGFVRTEFASKVSNARLWARVDKKKGTAFFNNMNDSPITDNEWKEYVIHGPIHKKAVKLSIGGLYFGSGQYYYDKFTLEVKRENGDWEEVKIVNPGFELDSYDSDWKSFYKVKGFKSKLTTENVYEGDKALLIDGSSRATDSSKFISGNGITVHYKDSGMGDTVLLLHGNSESMQSFSKQIPVLSKTYYVIAMDSRGQGYTSRYEKKITYELMAEDVYAFLNNLKIKSVNIIGWSDGGIIGLILAMNYPEKVRSLSIMGANLYNDDTSIDNKLNKTLKEELHRLTEPGNEDKFRVEMINLMLNEPNISPENLSKIKCPTLVMAGSNDVIKEQHTKLIASRIKNSRLIIFDKGTHYEPIENPERFNRAVINFLEQIKKD